MNLPSIIARLEKALPEWKFPDVLKTYPESSDVIWHTDGNGDTAMSDIHAAAIIVADVKEYLRSKTIPWSVHQIPNGDTRVGIGVGHWRTEPFGTELEALAAACEAMKGDTPRA